MTLPAALAQALPSPRGTRIAVSTPEGARVAVQYADGTIEVLSLPPQQPQGDAHGSQGWGEWTEGTAWGRRGNWRPG